MNHAVILLLLGAAIGFYGGMKYGQAHARALRAWRDLRATKDAIRGLMARTVTEWRYAVKVGVIAGAVVLAGIWVMVSHA